ncbi:hypothetical protein GPJ56_003641 [Histomonas meleagridis]|uniref:uncharacterized protein n=1 Tax=Histomonas meleagridis TaxID=135588 RepID=UPI00355A4C40|nr:hypothetical protein GPJ56_003641 [Histomonas meleagridis]KAH0800711.1 hypothetical protein GO595_006464 [Histomonas meleagridis]
MTDIERSISPNGFPDGYKFEQTLSDIVISFPVPENSTLDSIEFNIDQENNTIYASMQDQEYPSVCGVLYKSIQTEKHEITNSHFQITLQKTEPEIWPLLIKNESLHGIDPKSVFILGIYNDSKGLPREAFGMFKASANMGYFIAQVLVADTYLNEDNPYDIKKDIPQAIKILESIPPEKLSPDVAIKLANAYLSADRRIDAITTFRQIAQNSLEARLSLAKLLSPIASPGCGNDAEEAVSHLQILANENIVEAMNLLAQHYAKGCGVKKNMKEAKALAQKIKEIDPRAPEPIQSSGTVTTVIAAVSTAAILFGVGFLLKRRYYK